MQIVCLCTAEEETNGVQAVVQEGTKRHSRMSLRLGCRHIEQAYTYNEPWTALASQQKIDSHTVTGESCGSYRDHFRLTFETSTYFQITYYMFLN
jgi:hypothetical protein